MNKSLHRHTKKELVTVVQDFQEMTSEIEEILNTLLSFDHPIHTVTGLFDIRAAINRHIYKEPPEETPGCLNIEEVTNERDQGEREDHQCA